MSLFLAGSHESAASVAIIGGGFSGAILAAQLLRKSAGGVSVILIERNSGIGRGVAYGTRCTGHLLNVPAKDMSAFPDDPDHFLRWAHAHHHPAVQGSDFLPRCRYGEYAHSVLDDEVVRFPGRFESIRDEAIALDNLDGLVRVHLRNGPARSARKVVLALGNAPPADLPLPEEVCASPRYVRDPWGRGALEQFVPNDNFLLVGSGLTSVDVLIALRAAGHRGKVHLLSRHGLLPNRHRSVSPLPSFPADISETTLLGLVGTIRIQVLVARMRGYDWRAVIDAMRAATPRLWRSLPAREQRRFLRHLRPYWEIHRHRIAPETARHLESEIALGDAEIHAGRLTGCEQGADGIDVAWRDRRSSRLWELRVQRIINCTGPETDCRRIDSPLLANLLQTGLARAGHLCLGLDCADDGTLIDASGAAHSNLYALGPMRKGGLWESTAVPEIRIQAAALADRLIEARSEKPAELAVLRYHDASASAPEVSRLPGA